MKQIFNFHLGFLFLFLKKDGFIEFLEFEKLGKTVAIFDSNPDDLIEAFNAADANKDGKISLDGKTISDSL